MRRAILFLLAVITHFNQTCGSNVLFVSDPPSPSHQIFNYELAVGLLNKGYNVTMFGASPLKGNGQKNYHPIDIDGLNDFIHEDLSPETLLDVGMFDNFWAFYDFGLKSCNYTLQSKSLEFLLNYPKDFKFDLIIFDSTAGPCLLPLTQRFHYPPTVSVTAFLLPPYLSEPFGNDLHSSYLPFYMLRFGKEVSFFERLQNHFWMRLDMLMRKYYLEPETEALSREVFGQKMDSLESLQNHLSLLLCNIIPGYHYSQPLTPNIIPVGGLHINPAKTLPEDLQQIMDKAKHGVVLFSLGTNIKSSNLKEDKKRAIIEALGQLKQTVLWKFETELNNLPKNIIIRKWLPQREILAHPNLKVFISHGGGLSTIEASYFGVPVVGIPFFGDQQMNIQVMVNKDLGLRVDYLTMTSSSLLSKIKEVVENPMYQENAKKMSKIIRDQPQSPLDRAVFWLEYAIRHNGTHFLDPSSRQLPLLVSSSMDVYLFALFVLVVIVVSLVKILNVFKRILCGKETAKKLKKN